MRFALVTLLLFLGSSCTAIPINLPKVDGAAPASEMGGGFDTMAASDQGITMMDGAGPDSGPPGYADGGVDGMGLDALPIEDGAGDALPTDAVGEGLVGDGEPPDGAFDGSVDTVDTGGAATKDGADEG
jgi:hypothetical protein